MSTADMNMPTPTGYESHYLNHQTADVYFACRSADEVVRVPTHKVLLSKCPEFHEMFYGASPKEGDIPMPFPAAAFKEFLQFFYFNDFQLTMDSIFSVIDLLKQYQMTSGLAVCAYFLKENLTESNFLLVLELASVNSMLELKQFCEIRAPKLLTAKSLLTCTRDELVRFMQVGQLQTKFNLVEICAGWAQRACVQENVVSTMENIRTYLGDAIEHIDFGSMSQLHIKKNLQEYSELLSKGEMQRMSLVSLERGLPCIDNLTIQLLRKIPEKRYIDRFETLTLYVDMPLVLVLFTISSIYRGNLNEEESVSGQLVVAKHSSVDTNIESKVLLREEFSIYRSHSYSVYNLKSPVFIEPNLKYSIQVQLSMRNMKNFYVESKLIEVQDKWLGVRCTGKTIISNLGFVL